MRIVPGEFIDIDPKKGEWLQVLPIQQIDDGTGMDSPEAWNEWCQVTHVWGMTHEDPRP